MNITYGVVGVLLLGFSLYTWYNGDLDSKGYSNIIIAGASGLVGIGYSMRGKLLYVLNEAKKTYQEANEEARKEIEKEETDNSVSDNEVEKPVDELEQETEPQENEERDDKMSDNVFDLDTTEENDLKALRYLAKRVQSAGDVESDELIKKLNDKFYDIHKIGGTKVALTK